MIYIINKKVFMIGLSIAGGIITILWLTPLMDVILLYLRVDDVGSGREYLFNASLEVIKNNFVLGAGPGGTRRELYSNLPYLLNTPAEWLISRVYNLGDVNQNHNFYLFFFSDLGILGFLLSIALPVIFFTNCIRVFKAINYVQNVHYYIIIALIGCGVFIFSRGLVEQMNIISYGHIYYDLPFWLLMNVLNFYYNLYVEIQYQS